jgi:hypothetical protein
VPGGCRSHLGNLAREPQGTNASARAPRCLALLIQKAWKCPISFAPGADGNPGILERSSGLWSPTWSNGPMNEGAQETV